MELSAGKGFGAQSFGAVEPPTIHVIFDRGRSAQARQTRRIDLFHQNLHVPGRLLPGDVARRCRQPEDFQVRIQEGQCYREGAINSGVSYQDDFSGHRSPAGASTSL